MAMQVDVGKEEDPLKLAETPVETIAEVIILLHKQLSCPDFTSGCPVFGYTGCEVSSSVMERPTLYPPRLSAGSAASLEEDAGGEWRQV